MYCCFDLFYLVVVDRIQLKSGRQEVKIYESTRSREVTLAMVKRSKAVSLGFSCITTHVNSYFEFVFISNTYNYE